MGRRRYDCKVWAMLGAGSLVGMTAFLVGAYDWAALTALATLGGLSVLGAWTDE